MELRTNLPLLLKKKKLSLTQLAKSARVPLSTLHSWTTGKTTLNLEQLKRVSLALEVPTHELIYGCPDPFDSATDEVLKEIFAGDVRVTVHKILRKRKNVIGSKPNGGSK